MNQFKRILTVFTIIFVIITAVLGILLISDLISSAEAREAVLKSLQVIGILALASSVIMVILGINKSN